MKAYRIKQYEGEAEVLGSTRFVGTLGEADTHVKGLQKHQWPGTIVEEIEAQSDKDGFVAALNGEPFITVKRTFGVTSRGALKEER